MFGNSTSNHMNPGFYVRSIFESSWQKVFIILKLGTEYTLQTFHQVYLHVLSHTRLSNFQLHCSWRVPGFFHKALLNFMLFTLSELLETQKTILCTFYSLISEKLWHSVFFTSCRAHANAESFPFDLDEKSMCFAYDQTFRSGIQERCNIILF